MTLTKFSGTLKLIYLLALFFSALTIGFLIVAIILVGSLPIFSPVRLIVIALILYSVYGFGKIPCRIVLDNDRLTTYSLYGKRSIQLNNLKSATQIWHNQNSLQRRPVRLGGGLIIWLLKLEDNSRHSIYVQLGGLSEDKRRILAELLTRILSQKDISMSTDAKQLLVKWTKPESFWSV